MKKIILGSVIIALFAGIQANAQVGKFLKNVSKNVQKDLVGTPGSKTSSAKNTPEPPCACDPADLIIDLGKYKIDYSEASISILDDGSILLSDRVSGNAYIANNGTVTGPYRKDDPRVIKLQTKDQGEDNHADLTERFPGFISKKADKYVITFGGKSYGPYAIINNFVVSKSGDKFAAIVTPAVAMTEQEGKAMEAKAKNAKTDAEKMQLAMEYSQQMQKRMAEGGGAQSMMPRIVSNVPVAAPDDYTTLTILQAGQLYNNLRYDDILVVSSTRIMDLTGKTLMNLQGGDFCPARNMYLKSDNSGYACYRDGVLTFSDGKKLTELINPHLVKQDGKIYLAYLYFSPKNNAIMQCRIPY